MGAVFLKELLQSVLLITEGDSAVSASDLDVWNLSQAAVQREWHHIDILIVDNSNRFAVLIENKVDTGEHSDQLNRYYTEFHRHFPGYKAVALYLTPDGEEPSSSDYHAVSYKTICEVIEKTAHGNCAMLNSEIMMVLEHYVQMLRRHIVSDSDVAELCRSIYHKHRQALDLIFEHRPDQRAQILQYVKSLVHRQTSMKYYNEGKHYLNFGLNDWNASALHRGEIPDRFWLPYLTFENARDSLAVGMWIGPGDQTDREKLLDMATRHHLTGVSRKLTSKYSRICSTRILQARDYEKSQEEIEILISEKWAEFMRDELPRIVKAVREEEWLWELPS